MTYSEEHLDSLTLMERVNLAQQGEISWLQVNRPEADQAREEKTRAQQALSRPWELYKGAPLCQSAKEVRRRRELRRYPERQARKAFHEMMKEQGINTLKGVTLPHFPAIVSARG